MIKLFNSTDKLFSSNGDKIIIPTKAKIHKEDNGAYYLYLETGIEYVNDLIQGNIIVAPTPQGEQAFRLSNPEKTKSKLRVKANHVFYDTNNYLILDSYVVDKNCNDALDHLNSATDNLSPFTTLSNITNINSYRCVRKSLYEAINVVLERWGGHLVRDNFDIKIMAAIGQDNGVTVRYAKNLKDITCIENWDNVVTKLLPVGKDGLLLPEQYIYSEIQYSIPYTKTVSFEQNNVNEDDYKDEQGNLDENAYNTALVEDLRDQATNYIQNNSIPQVNYTLKANLEKITDIGDTIEVIDERLGIDILTNLISYDYDCILDKYIELEFGNFTQKLSDLLGTITTNTNNAITNSNNMIISTFNDALQELKSRIWNTLESGYCIFEGSKILIVDTLPKENATNVIMINNNGISFSNTGINGPFSIAWTMDNKLNVANLTSTLVKSDALEIYNNNNLIAILNQIGLTLYGNKNIVVNGKSLLPITLYNDSNGSDGIITLNNSTANYSYLEIFYTDENDKINNSVKIHNPNGKYIVLSSIDVETNKNTYIRRTEYLISGNTITPDTNNSGYVLIADNLISTTASGTNNLKITRVLGWE